MAETIVRVAAVSDICAELYQRREHAILGISLFNSYFSLTNLSTLCTWARRHFDSFSLFVPDQATTYTLQALGYSPERAQVKAARQAAYLRNKCNKALRAAGAVEPVAVHHIRDSQWLKSRASYRESLASYRRHYVQNAEFRDRCLNFTHTTLSRRAERVSAEQRAIGVEYLIAELPLILDGARVLEQPSALFCYHQCPDFFGRFFRERSALMNANQGYLTVQLADYP